MMMPEVGLRCGGVLVEGPSCVSLRMVWTYASRDVVGIYEGTFDCQAVQ